MSTENNMHTVAIILINIVKTVDLSYMRSIIVRIEDVDNSILL